MNLIDDLDIFLSDLGTPAVISQPGVPDIETRVLLNLNSLTEIGILTDKPSITIKSSDLAGVDIKTATITITDKYPASRIIKPIDDGAGLTIANLAQA